MEVLENLSLIEVISSFSQNKNTIRKILIPSKKIQWEIKIYLYLYKTKTFTCERSLFRSSTTLACFFAKSYNCTASSNNPLSSESAATNSIILPVSTRSPNLSTRPGVLDPSGISWPRSRSNSRLSRTSSPTHDMNRLELRPPWTVKRIRYNKL